MEETRIYGVYARADGQGRVTEINSEGLLDSLDGWVRVGEYESDAPYAQGGYFGEPIITDDGVWRYKLVDDQVVERSPEEMEADAMPEEPPMTVQALQEKIDMLTECLLEMSEVIYAGQ